MKKNGRMAHAEPEHALVPGLPSELQETKAMAEVVVEWFGRLRVFLLRAGELEVTALETLATAQRLVVPTNGAQDEAIQRFIKTANADKGVVEDHWKPITSALHGLHKRFTGRRSKSVDALEKAASIGNRMHNDYVEAERRRVQQEEDRIRIANEQKAREDRQRELDAIERKALEAEGASPQLSEREALFVQFIGRGLSAVAAARQAGYQSPETRGPRLLDTPKIGESLKAADRAAALRQQKDAIAAQPVEVEAPTVFADISTAYGSDRTTYKAVVEDEAAFIAAFKAGTHGIPNEAMSYKQSVLTQHAQSLKMNLNWPGVKVVKSTSLV